ncbi:MAG: 3-phosphoshikimate 1-carboxyvinyltransferase [Chitinophagaceae bacterium]
MNASINPSSLKGIVQAPASKSSMQRACAAALIKKGKTLIHNPGHSEDDKAALDIIKRLGAEVQQVGDSLEMISQGIHPIDEELNCGESGLSIRMFTPIAAVSNQRFVITGSGSLSSRPMDVFDKVFPELGIQIKSKKGKLPLVVQGPLQPKDIEIDGSLSSQYLTGLLMAYAAADAKDVSIRVKNLASVPYIDLTLAIMKDFGLKVPENKSYKEFYFDSACHDQQPADHEYTIEGDWSGSAFLLVAGAIAGPITVRGLDLASTQADKAIIDALMSANAGIAMEAKGIKIHPSAMKAFEFDATDCPDLFPPLVALAAYCKGETILKGVNRLVYKESNRALSLWEEFGKMGVDIKVKGDLMMINGGEPLKPATVHSHLDHRIAMACTVAALRSTGKTTLEKPGAVKKSYPDFYNDLKSLGADVSLPFHFKL